MGISGFGYAIFGVVVGAPLLAIAALVNTFLRHQFQIVDLGTLLLPPIAFELVGLWRPEIQIGFATFLLQIIIAVVSMYLYAVKVFAFDPMLPNRTRASFGLFIVCLFGAVALGAMVPAWGE